MPGSGDPGRYPRPMPDRWSQDDLIAAESAPRSYPVLEDPIGREVFHRGSGLRGTIVAFTERTRVVIEDPVGGHHEFKPFDGSFEHEGRPVALRTGTRRRSATGTGITRSGSIDTGPARARVARAGRIWVEGIHDAELVEHIWGDDLRIEGIVVEPVHGIDNLEGQVRTFRPGSGRRLGVLLDHLVPGTKEAAIADRVAGAHVLVTGHPFVDIWQAIRPGVAGFDAWPSVPMGRPWKEGVIAALEIDTVPGVFWKTVLSRVSGYQDVETPLVTAMESLIDFVTAP